MKTTLLLALAACSAPADPASGPGDARTWLDLPYPGGDADLATLDLYAPAAPAERLAVFVHGGSWVGGDKENLAQAEALVPWLHERGYVVAAPNFRLATDVGGPPAPSWEEMCVDVAAAVATAEDLAVPLGVEEPETLLIGFSSGAHLVALLGADARFLDDAGASPPAATVSLDVHAYDVPRALELMPGTEIEPNIPLVEHVFGTAVEDQLAGSPAAYLDDGAPPAWLASVGASGDPSLRGYVAETTSAEYAARLDEAGVTSEHRHYPAKTHEGLVLGLGQPDDPPTEDLTAFLDRL